MIKKKISKKKISSTLTITEKLYVGLNWVKPYCFNDCVKKMEWKKSPLIIKSNRTGIFTSPRFIEHIPRILCWGIQRPDSGSCLSTFDEIDPTTFSVELFAGRPQSRAVLGDPNVQ